jgi:hypothetical protein
MKSTRSKIVRDTVPLSDKNDRARKMFHKIMGNLGKMQAIYSINLDP